MINKTRFEIYLASVIIAAQFPGRDKSFCKDLSSKNVNNLLAEVLDYIGALIRMQSYLKITRSLKICSYRVRLFITRARGVNDSMLKMSGIE